VESGGSRGTPVKRLDLCNLSGEQIFSDIVSTSSSIFTADRFSDFSDGCYSSGPSTYTTNSVVPEGVLAFSYSNVGGWMKIDWLCKCTTTAWKILVNTRGVVDRPNASS
jgi:hypothetical protein